MDNLPAVDLRVNTDSLSEAEQRRCDRLAERETVVQYDDAGPLARVFTCHRRLAASLLRRGVRPVRENRRDGRVESWSFEVPKSWITVRPPRRLRLTAEQRQALSERAGLLKNHVLSASPREEVVQVRR